jgi:hypothetical protein
MSAKLDCPICMDCIESTTKNCVTTECGHCFHTNCLMQNVVHNGFGCPYCRTIMAEESEEEEEDYDEVYDNDENVLRGFRFFFNNLSGEEHDADDIREEEQMCDEDDEDAEEAEPDNSSVIPSTAFVAEKLREQGVTFEHLVKLICETEHEEFESNEETKNIGDKLYGKVRRILANYVPEDGEGNEGGEPSADMVMSSRVRRVPNIEWI